MTQADATEVAARLARLEAHVQIRQLASRYALAVDTRDLDTLVGLFVEDVRVGNGQTGRAALKEWFDGVLSAFHVSIHQVMNHVIDFQDENNATGVVYCRDELEQNGRWLVGVIQYWDTYVRRDGRWQFRKRKLHRWYMGDALDRPVHGRNDRPRDAQPILPDAWPTWDRFWEGKQRPL